MVCAYFLCNSMQCYTEFSIYSDKSFIYKRADFRISAAFSIASSSSVRSCCRLSKSDDAMSHSDVSVARYLRAVCFEQVRLNLPVCLAYPSKYPIHFLKIQKVCTMFSNLLEFRECFVKFRQISKTFLRKTTRLTFFFQKLNS